MTDEQIIAAAGEPVAFHLCNGCGHYYQVPVSSCDCMDGSQLVETKFYTAADILAAAKPRRERIAELEAEVGRLVIAVADHVTVRGELTKERDGAMADAERWRFIELHWSAADIRNNKDGSFKSMTITFKSEQLSDQINRDKLCRGFDAAIAAHKTGGAA